LDLLRKNIPRDETGVDLKIPSSEEIIRSLRVISKAPIKYRALYNLILDSGLRLIEACKLINDFEKTKVEGFNGFYVAQLGWMVHRRMEFSLMSILSLEGHLAI